MTTLEIPHPLGRWPAARIARLGFLIGQGLDAARVARDPLIASTSANVHRQARRYDAAAARRRLTREELCRLLLVTAGSDDGLIDNILDDGD